MPTTCTPDEAVSLIRPVDTIGFGLGPANPDTFLTALGSRDDWQDLELGGALCLNFYEVFTKPGVHLPLRVLRPGGTAAAFDGTPRRAGPGRLPSDGADPGQVRAAGHGGAGGTRQTTTAN